MKAQDLNGLRHEATQFITLYFEELGYTAEERIRRLEEVHTQIEEQGTYVHTLDELTYGAKVAWRNSNRCIGRLFWDSLDVIDARGAQTFEQIDWALLNHIKQATNDGKIKPTITVFAQERLDEPTIRIWNHELIRYAGYRTEDGVLGDPDSISFTETCIELGWQPPGTPFDVLPIVYTLGIRSQHLLPIPESLILEVALTHPTYEWFKDLNLKWFALPIISDMALDIGGIRYPAAPFNGWYMGTEIGARNLADEHRYDLLPLIASKMGLDTSSSASLWQDKSLVELNIAVLHSFKQSSVSIVDHHTAARQFGYFERTEADNGRTVTGDWTWLIPPMSPASTHIFHRDYNPDMRFPNYVHQPAPDRT